MVNFLEKLTGRRPEDDDRERSLSPRHEGQHLAVKPSRLAQSRSRTAQNSRIPNASIVYGAAAAAFFVIAMYFLFVKGILMTGLLILALAGALFGYALLYTRFQN